VASNVEFLTDETFSYADTLKAKTTGEDFLTMAMAQQDTCTEQGRHSQKLQDSLAHSNSSADQIARLSRGPTPQDLKESGNFADERQIAE